MSDFSYVDGALQREEAMHAMPEPIGGLEALQAQLQYPAGAPDVEGQVVVKFTVAEDGSVRNATILKGLGPALDQEALRVIRQARFEPGRQRGMAVPVHMALPLYFKRT